MEKTSITRRGFVAGAAATGAVIAAGTTASALAEEPSWDGEYDVIVAGAGIAGLSAAMTVATEGDGDTCLLVEKGAEPMGNSPYCGGGACYSDAEHLEQLKTYMTACLGRCTPQDVIDAYCEELTTIKDWLVSIGVPENQINASTISDDINDNATLVEYPELAGWESLGSILPVSNAPEGPTHIHPWLLEKVQTFDTVTYMPSTPLEELIQDPETREVTGVVAGGKRYKANKGVIVCTGGFENDPEMAFTHMGIHGLIPAAAALNTGDGQRICAKAGADMWHMYGSNGNWMALRNLANDQFVNPAFFFHTSEYGIKVSVGGRRFFMDFDGCCPRFPFGYCEPYSDIRTNVVPRHGNQQFGGEWKALPLPEKAWFVFDQAGLEAGAFPADRSTDPVGEGWMYQADTIEELAGMMEVPPEELSRTVATWNRYCEQGFDEAFYRPEDTLTPVAQAPFYAMLCVPSMLNTWGGPRHNVRCEVVDPFGEPIPHLYAAGEVSSVYGEYYQGAGNVAECFGRGHTAAQNAMMN